MEQVILNKDTLITVFE